MKTKNIFYVAILFFLAFSILSCSSGLIDGLTIKSVSKTEYVVGEDFDYSSLVVEYVSSGIAQNLTVTSNMISGFDSSSPTNSQTITLTWGGFTATFNIKIKAEDLSDLILQSISVDLANTKTDYEQGDELDESQILINRVYSSSSGNVTKTIKGNLTGVEVTGFDSSVVGSTPTLTVSYGNKTTTFTVNILEKVSDYAKNKYTNPGFTDTNQSTWKALNCHDPKLFQDDDGTYYVYSTDASIGNAHKTGVQVRSSTDLIDWTCESNSAIQGNWDPNMLSWVGQTTSTATTWAPTVIKQNGKYYMFHGIITDSITVDSKSRPAAWIGLAIADSPKGPFKPAHVYDPDTYSHSTLVRYAWKAIGGTTSSSSFSSYIGGEMTKMTVKSIKVNDVEKLTSDATLAATGDWYDFTTTAYKGVTSLTGDFTVEYTFILDTPGAENYQKWSFVLTDGSSTWYLRADSWTNDMSFQNSNMYNYGETANVAYDYSWDWNAATTDSNSFASTFAAGTEVVVKAVYTESTGGCVVTASVGGSTVYTATATATVEDTTVYSTTKNTAYYNTKTQAYESDYGWSYGFGAIDPEFVYDIATGELVTDSYGDYYMIYGSWKGGIALITVDNETFKPTLNGVVLTRPADETAGAFGKIIAGGAGAGYEGAQLIYNSDTGYYYIFVSMGDLSYEYRVGVGRSSTIDGTYLDANGNSMTNVNTSASGSENNYHNRGNKILGAHIFNGEYGWSSPGGLSILRTSENKVILAAHSRTTFFAGYYFYLQLRQMYFTDTDWPVLNANEYHNETLASLSKETIAGTYDSILTVRDPAYATNSSDVKVNTADATATTSKTMVLNTDGSITGDNYSGTWTLGSDGYSITINLKNTSGADLGTFTGVVTRAVDWARKGTTTERRTISFTTMCANASATEAGEHFFGNKQ